MEPLLQGDLDSLCGIYSVVNADRIINNTSLDDSQELFDSIVNFLDQRYSLPEIVQEGMLFKHIKLIMNEVIGGRIPYRKIRCAGMRNPDLNTFWAMVASFFYDNPKGAIIQGTSGIHEHWTVIKRVTVKQIKLVDSDNLCHFNRRCCTTAAEKGKRQHVLNPAQAIFLHK